MSRLLTLWLIFLAAFWLTRAGTSALVFGHVERGAGETVQILLIPALQALLVAWLTRPRRPRPPG